MAGSAPHIPGCRDLSLIGERVARSLFSAYSDRVGRPVTVTVFPPLSEGRTRAGFDAAAATAQRLGAHPSVLTIHEWGHAPDGRPWIVTDPQPAESVDNLLTMDGPLDVDRAVQVGVLLAGALETAHRAGIVHGDLQPARLVFGAQGEPLLVETGLAAFAVFPGLGALNNPVRYHAPPEVLERTDVTPATDVYSLATTVYALIAGRAPAAEARRDHRQQRLAAPPHPADAGAPPSSAPACRRASRTRCSGRSPPAPASGRSRRSRWPGCCRTSSAATVWPSPSPWSSTSTTSPAVARARPPRRRWGRRRRRPWLAALARHRPSRPGPPPPSPSRPGPPPRPGSPPCPTSRRPRARSPPAHHLPVRRGLRRRPARATRSGPCPRPPIPTMRSPCRACRRPETTTRPPCGATRRPPRTASRCGRPHGPPTSLRPTAPTRCGRPRGRRPTRVRRLRGRRRL